MVVLAVYQHSTEFTGILIAYLRLSKMLQKSILFPLTPCNARRCAAVEDSNVLLQQSVNQK